MAQLSPPNSMATAMGGSDIRYRTEPYPLREGALMQTFPKEYSFIPAGESVQISSVARLIGNAVPVKLGEAIGKSIVAHLERFHD